MTKGFRSLIFIFILLTLILTNIGICFADTESLDVNDIKKYNFDTPQNKNTKVSSPAKNILTFFVYLFIFIIVSYLAYLATKWIAKQQVHINNKSKYMEVIDCLPLSKDNRIYIIKAPQGLLMIGVSVNGVNILEELGEDESRIINELEFNMELQRDDFSSTVEEFIKKIKKS